MPGKGAMNLNFCRVTRRLALRYGEREAVVNVERHRHFSFREYHLLTNRIANALRGPLGVGAGDRFMLMLENDNLSLLQIPTVLKQEGTVVMTDVRDTLEAHRWQIDVAKPKVVFIENRLLETHLPMLREAGCTVVVMDAIEALPAGTFRFWDLVAAASDRDNDVAIDRRAHTVLMRFIGGTSEIGTFASYSIDDLLGCCDGALLPPEFGINLNTRMLHATPLSRGAQMIFHPVFYNGGANITTNALDLDLWRKAAEAERVTHAFLVPTALDRMLELQRARPRDLSNLRTLIYGAEPMSAVKAQDVLACLGTRSSVCPNCSAHGRTVCLACAR